MQGSMASYRRQVPADVDRLLVVMSDIEMGAGGIIDDFPHSDFLGELILSYNEGALASLPVELVFNGDTFDLLKTPYMGEHPRHITRDVALGKMSTVAAAHPRFFEALRRFLRTAEAERNIYFITGNHDAELAFSEVQQFIRSLCGNDARVMFPGYTVDFGAVHVEHGSQHDSMFRVEPDLPFSSFKGEDVLTVSWGAAALLDTVMQHQQLLCFHDRLKPKERVFELLPEVKELLINSFWRYWTKDYWKGYFGADDPTKRLSWTMLKEVMSRFASQRPEVSMDRALMQQLESTDRYRLYLVGHQHQPGWWSYGDRKLLQTGCFRNEYMLSEDGNSFRSIPKVYAEVWMRGAIPLCSELIEVQGPAAPEAQNPASIFDVLPSVRELLAEAQDRGEQQRAQQEQEEKEEKEAAQSR